MELGRARKSIAFSMYRGVEDDAGVVGLVWQSSGSASLL